ncbi:uncharacterized protein LOC118277659 [Spodoptera frugiperda]|uniref:Uncharacterized protein LOC118277659 n=1 Tax=Spodoptera frugiperda TaxID=7108 RepID=A0A9R0DGG6_SPOFR|nr:uncharacterized protein LOC118277659 [Spodoptera frugiperda]
MLMCMVAFVPILLLLNGIDTTLLEPAKQCVPTTSVRGPCHLCVCSSEGIFHCRPKECEEDDAQSNEATEDCQPNNLYRINNRFCTCSNDGYWESENCEEEFHYLHPKKGINNYYLRTSVACTPNEYFLIDCNLCRCSPKGIIDVTLCTNRYCGQGHKADICAYGDVLRTENELCSCSDINYYIDRLCIRILNEPIQIVPTREIMKLDDVGKTRSVLRVDCNTDAVYEVNCNKCLCKNGDLVCTDAVCEHKKGAVRAEKKNEIEILPELKSVVGAVCQPGRRYRYKCNICSCTKDGFPSCTTMVCLEDYVLDIKSLRGLLSSNSVANNRISIPFHKPILAKDVTKSKKLQDIKYGMKCVPGQTYKMDCNTCRCGYHNNLLCTKAICIDQKQTEIIKEPDPEPIQTKKSSSSSKVVDLNSIIGKKKKIRRIIRRENKRYLNIGTTGLPTLPLSNICMPGRIYQSGCRRCYCKANKSASCSNENACNETKVVRLLKPEDVRPPVKDKEFRDLPELPNTAAPCAPGTTYKVDCNVCLCDEFQNLMCDKMLCVSFSDVHKAEAMQKSGLPCNSNDFTENMVLQSKCVECTCNGTTFCVAKANCITEAETMQRSISGRRTFDMKSEKCIPDKVYHDDCNRCYCQKDRTLRCTQKRCLNYREAVELQEQQKYLLEHGL